MNFGPTFICPPYNIVLYYYPDYYIATPMQLQQNPGALECTNAEINSVSECEHEKILVTRQDLQEEGYEHTKKAWTEDQDLLLLKLCADQRSRFEEIAALMPGRNAKMCYSRFRRLTNQSKDCWSKAENEKLTTLVQTQGEDHWKEFVKYFPNRNYKQLKDHYENYLRPNLTNQEWSLQDDLDLIRFINKYGKNWKVIEGLMPGRSRNQLKNRFFGRIKRLNSRKIALLNKQETCSGNKLSLSPI